MRALPLRSLSFSSQAANSAVRIRVFIPEPLYLFGYKRASRKRAPARRLCPSGGCCRCESVSGFSKLLVKPATNRELTAVLHIEIGSAPDSADSTRSAGVEAWMARARGREPSRIPPFLLQLEPHPVHPSTPRGLSPWGKGSPVAPPTALRLGTFRVAASRICASSIGGSRRRRPRSSHGGPCCSAPETRHQTSSTPSSAKRFVSTTSPSRTGSSAD